MEGIVRGLCPEPETDEENCLTIVHNIVERNADDGLS